MYPLQDTTLPAIFPLHPSPRGWNSQILIRGLQQRPLDWLEIFDYQDAVAEMRKKADGEPYDEDAWGKVARQITPTPIIWYEFGSRFNDELQPDETKKRHRPPYFFDP